MPTDDRIEPGRTYLDEQGRYREGQGRAEPPEGAGEIATLLGYLERQRATFAWKAGGLDAAGLGVTLGPSSMTLGGMLKHLARFEDAMSTEWLLGREQAAAMERHRLGDRPRLGLAERRRRHAAGALRGLDGRGRSLPRDRG